MARVAPGAATAVAIVAVIVGGSPADGENSTEGEV